MTLQRWGGLASFTMAVSAVAAGLIYLTGNLRDAVGPLSYSLADFLYGPVFAASLITAVSALRERMGEAAPRRMHTALLAAFLAAGAMAAVAFIRASNRHYHLIHPELNLEHSKEILTVWTTLVAGVTATGWHFLGWLLVLIGSAAWSSRLLPRGLSVLYLLAGAASLFVYALPALESTAGTFAMAASVWQGVLLWRSEPVKKRATRGRRAPAGRARV